MSEEKEIVVEYNPDIQAEGEQVEEAQNVVIFKHPYTFERKTYTQVDLSGIERLTVKDAIDIQRQLFEQKEVAASLLTETTTAFARAIAAKVSGRPIEFFKMMPRGTSRQVMLAVREQAIGAKNDTQNHVMYLDKPYFFGGEEYREIDLNGIANLNSMNDSEAENRMAREGFVVTETSFNYLYACVIASMATGLPEAFFTGLPICETAKLKNAVNDGDFFE